MSHRDDDRQQHLQDEDEGEAGDPVVCLELRRAAGLVVGGRLPALKPRTGLTLSGVWDESVEIVSDEPANAPWW